MSYNISFNYQKDNMNEKQYSYHLNHLDRVYYYLDKPDLYRDAKSGQIKQFNLAQRICLCVSKIFMRIARIWNYLCGDHHVYNELKARKIVIHYLNSKERTAKQTEHILNIYKRLSVLSFGNGTYADGIDKEKIIALESSPKTADPVTKPAENPATNPATNSSTKISQTKKTKWQKPDPLPKIDPKTYLTSSEPEEKTLSEPDEAALAHKFVDLNLKYSSNRMLMHLHGNRFGENSKLEGFTSNQESMEYLHGYLKAWNSNIATPQPIVTEFTEKLSSAIELNNQKTIPEFVSCGQSQLQKAFEQKKAMFIPGGWVSYVKKDPPVVQMQTICYEIIPDSAEEATLRFYTSDTGLEHHKSGYVGNKIKFQPYVEWKGISKDKLTDAHFLTAVAELQRYALSPKQEMTSYTDADIYDAFKMILKPKTIDAGEKPNASFSKCSARVSTMKSWFVALKTNLETQGVQGKAIYKRFKCDIRVQSLVDHIRNRKSSMELKEAAEYRLVQKSLQKTTRAVNRLYDNNFVSRKYFVEVNNALSPVQKWVDSNQIVLSSRPQNNAPYFREPDHSINLFSNTPTLEATAKAGSNVITNSNGGFLVDTIRILSNVTPEEFATALEKIEKTGMDAWNNGADKPLYTALHAFISRLSVDKAFWEKVCAKGGKEGTKAVITSLGNVAKLYFKTCCAIPQSEIMVPERIQDMTRIELIFKHLSELAGHKMGFVNYIKTQYFIHGSASAEKIVTDLKDFGNAHILYDAGGEFSHPANDLPALVRKLPEFEKIKRKIEDFETLPLHAQDARLYCSNDLPEWLKMIRDNHICLCHLSSGVIAKPLEIDRENHFEVAFKIEDNPKEYRSQVKTGIVGIDAEGAASHYPILSSIRGGYLSRFEPMHGEIASEKLRKLLKIALSNNNYGHTEKILLSRPKDCENISMTFEEYQELVHIFLNDQTRIPELLEYFKKYPEKLQEKDYQIFFRIALFSPGIMEIGLKSDGVMQSLEGFLESQFNFWMNNGNNIQGCTFLIQCYRFLNTYDPKRFPSDLTKVRKLLSRAELEPEEKSVIYSELIAHLSNCDSTQLKPEDLHDMLVGKAYLHDNPVPKKWREMLTDNEVMKASYHHAKAICNYLSPKGKVNSERLNAIISSLKKSSEKVNWDLVVSGDRVEYESVDKRYLYRPMDGLLIDRQQKEVYLPIEIRHHPQFGKLFPNIEKGQRIADDIFTFTDPQGLKTNIAVNDYGTLSIEQLNAVSFYKKQEETDLPSRLLDNPQFKLLHPNVKKGIIFTHPHTIYSFKDEQGSENFAYFDGKENLFIERNWVRYISATGQALISRYLVQKYSAWQPTHSRGKDKLYLRSFQKGEIEYEATVSKSPYFNSDIISKITHLKQSWLLSQPSMMMSSFESLDYIHEWYDEKRVLKKIELPRFSLSFTVNGSQYQCDQIPGYSLAKDQPVSMLGGYKYFIVLENADKQKKVLLPQWNYMNAFEPEVFEALVFPTYNYNDPEATERYFVYDLNSAGALTTKALEANLYLFQALTSAQEYRSAANYLKQYGRKISLYNAVETNILLQIVTQAKSTADFDGNACALRTYAGFLLLKNGSNYRVKNKGALIATANAYSMYLQRFRNATEIRLDKNEEIFLLTTFLQDEETFNSLFLLRLRELDPISANEIEIREDKDKCYHHKNEREIGSVVPRFEWEMWGNCERKLNYDFPDTKDILITRIHTYIHKNFWRYYHLALKGSEEQKHWLRHAITYLQVSSNEHYNLWGTLFGYIFDHPDRFVMPPVESNRLINNEENGKLYDWHHEFIKTINELHEKAKGATVNAHQKGQLLNLTPADFKIEKSKSEVIPSATIKGVVMRPLRSWWEQSNDWTKPLPNHFESDSKLFSSWINGKISASESGSKEDSALKLQKQAYEFLKEDNEHFQKIKNESRVRITVESLPVIKWLLAYQKQESLEFLQFKRMHIENLANKFPATEPEASIRSLKISGGLFKPLTLEETIVCFAKSIQQPNAMKERNPALTDEDLSNLFTEIFEYLRLAIHEQQRDRALETLRKLEKLKSMKDYDHVAENDLLDQLTTDLTAHHYHDANDKVPCCKGHYLAFEYFAGIILRHEQVVKIEQFLKNGDHHIIMEMLMGFGKSKIMLPLLALLLAKQDTLALLISPQSLFENLSSDTQRIIQDAFGQVLHSLNFDRNTTFTTHSLRNILRDITTTQEKGDCLLMTSKSLQCLILKFIEAFDDHLIKYKGDPKAIVKLPEELKLMQQILLRFNSARTVVDEADSVLNVLRKVCFSMGERKSPSMHEVRLISEIYRLLYNDLELKALGRLESDPQPNEKAPAFTEKTYTEDIKRVLAKKVIKLFANIKLESTAHEEALAAFTETLKTGDNKKLLMGYLCRDDKLRTESQKFYHAQKVEVQEVIALAGQMISQFLPHTLTRISNEKYGVDPDSLFAFAVPFLAANTPSQGSQFANHHITMMYTFQAIIKNGVTYSMVEHEVARIQAEVMREINEKGKEFSPENTEAYKRFVLLKGNIDIPLFKYKPKQLQAVVDSINKSIETKRSFAEQIVIPQLELYAEQISCNPINLASHLPYVSGFTGTLWNSRSMHRKTTPDAAKGISAKTLEILLKNSQEVVDLDQSTTIKMLQQLKKDNVSYDVIIDVGGYFKQGTNLQIAREIALFHGKHVVFYNNRGEQTITDGRIEMPLSQSSVSENERITFLDQDHTTGADVRYKRNAIGLVTVGPLLLDRDLKQGSWRLRALDKLQKVVPAVSNDVKAVIQQTTNTKGKITIDQIIEFGIINQCAQQSRDNFQSYLQQLWDIPQQILLSVLKNQKLTPEQHFETLKELRSLWVKPGINSAHVLYGRIAFERPVKEVVNEESSRCEKYLAELYKKLPWMEKDGVAQQMLLKEVKALQDKMIDALPMNAIHPQQDAEQSMEIEQQQEQETEREVQLETQNEMQDHLQQLGSVGVGNFVDVELNDDALKHTFAMTQRVSLAEFFNQDAFLKSYADAFDDLKISMNAFAWQHGEKLNIKMLQLFGIYRTPLHFVEVDGEEVTIMNQQDAASRLLRPYFFLQNSIKNIKVYNLGIGFCVAKEEPSHDVYKKIVKVKFLNGDTHYNLKEKELLQEWLEECGPDRMKQLFFDRILPGFPNKAASYPKSILQQVFKKLIG